MDPITQAALVQAGGGIIGGLLGKGKAPKTQWDFEERERLETERFRWLVKGARRAGFNPLTVLGATGGALGGGPVSTSSPLTTRQIVGRAIADAASRFDPIAAETEQLEQDLLRKQIDQIDKENQRYGQTNQGSGSAMGKRLGGVRGVQTPSQPTAGQVPVDPATPGGIYQSGVVRPDGVPTDLKTNLILSEGERPEPVELETDYFGAWRASTLGQVVRDDIKRNVSPETFDNLSDWWGIASTIGRAWGEIPDIVRRAGEELRDNPIVTRKRVMRKPGAPPKTWRDKYIPKISIIRP